MQKTPNVGSFFPPNYNWCSYATTECFKSTKYATNHFISWQKSINLYTITDVGQGNLRLRKDLPSSNALEGQTEQHIVSLVLHRPTDMGPQLVISINLSSSLDDHLPAV